MHAVQLSYISPAAPFPKINLVPIYITKAGYTATLVACGWAGARLEKVTSASRQEPYAQKAKKVKKGPTNRPTNQPTDRRTDIARYRVA